MGAEISPLISKEGSMSRPQASSPISTSRIGAETSPLIKLRRMGG